MMLAAWLIVSRQPAASRQQPPPAQPTPGRCPTLPGSFFMCRAAANTPCQFLIDFNLRPGAEVGAAGQEARLRLKWAALSSRVPAEGYAGRRGASERLWGGSEYRRCGARGCGSLRVPP